MGGGVRASAEVDEEDELLCEASSVASSSSVTRTPRGRRGGRTGNQRQAADRTQPPQQLY